MADRLTIDTEVLLRHAARVDQVAADVGVAKDAAGSVNLGGGAFGLMCSFLVPPLDAVSNAARSALAAADGMVARSAREVRGMAGDFDSLEDGIGENLRNYRRELDGLIS